MEPTQEHPLRETIRPGVWWRADGVPFFIVHIFRGRGYFRVSYIDLTEANEYFGGRLHADAWTAATDADKEKALNMATRAIDRLPLKGCKTEDDQANQFPRHPDEEIPQAVKDACCEEALALLERGNNQRHKLQQEGVQSFTLARQYE